MSLTETVIEGTLKPDGTLELDERPKLPPGRVSVHLRPVPPLPAGDPFFDMLQGIWQARAAAGLTPRSVEEVEADRQRWRDDSAEEVAEAMRRSRECASSHETLLPRNGASE